MKHLLALFVFTTLSTTAFAHPGGHTLVCHSAKNSGSKQNFAITLKRSNGTGWFNPTIDVTVANKQIELTTPDEMNNYGTTFHNSPLKVITVTAEVPFEKASNTGYLSIVAMPDTVKAYDNENKPVKWSLQSEKDECNDSNGRATFQAIVHGNIYEGEAENNVDTQILDCELTYNSGMAC
jgi:hypothetical protein